ncbi:MAG: ATP-binding protein [Chloroflexi bacterium]|nr:MAG: ATP-binding protein [Chloroflexota bacterium]TMF11872.1 MAG: ATP-binding protein [Chloroflexota bacterium]TMF32716.1 MAG: ATP-binding protein [Chloroflexota bacterium]TMF48741.1 MAG: ATP-binding protein [Chloroflexota bacterium]TMG27541.1 MAG: ATP-binding protein [Chloroflexota bacterium]
MAKRNLAELKIPAASAFIPVAKRVATTLGGQLGLSLMDLDELAIALTQACDSAIAAADDLGTPADLKLTYFATNRALVVDVDLMPTGAALPLPRHETHIDPELQRLAYEMIRCFVDDFRPSIEPLTGHVSFRMVKHLAG